MRRQRTKAGPQPRLCPLTPVKGLVDVVVVLLHVHLALIGVLEPLHRQAVELDDLAVFQEAHHQGQAAGQIADGGLPPHAVAKGRHHHQGDDDPGDLLLGVELFHHVRLHHAQVDHGLSEALLHREQADGVEHAGGHHEKRKQRNDGLENENHQSFVIQKSILLLL